MVRISVLGGILVATSLMAPVVGAEVEGRESSRAILTIRAIRPDEQLARLIALFEGEAVGHPAEALAAWRRATGRHDGLSKAVQAGVALLNPEMVDELRTLRDAEFRFGLGASGLEAERLGPWWNASLPGDDGTVAAIATALVLTDGSALPAIDGAEVDRIGPPGAPVLARDSSGGIALASHPAQLDEALARLRIGPDRDMTNGRAPREGWVARIDIPALGNVAGGSGSLTRRRIAEGLSGLGCREVEAMATLRGEALEVVVTGLYPEIPPVDASLDPSWLDWVPVERVAAAVSFATDEAGAAWNAAFRAADRAERADPSRAEAAPLRARIGLIALAVGIRPEADLWPLVRGITLCVTVDASEDPNGALMVLHARDHISAQRIASRVIRPLTARLGVEGIVARPEKSPPPDDGEVVGRAYGRPLELAVRGRSVLVAWGTDMLASSLEARAFPGRSAGPMLRASWTDSEDPPQRAGGFWPGCVRTLDSNPALVDSAFSLALDDASPVLWWGSAADNLTRDHLRWGGLRSLVHGVLERLPMKPQSRVGEPE